MEATRSMGCLGRACGLGTVRAGTPPAKHLEGCGHCGLGTPQARAQCWRCCRLGHCRVGSPRAGDTEEGTLQSKDPRRGA